MICDVINHIPESHRIAGMTSNFTMDVINAKLSDFCYNF